MCQLRFEQIREKEVKRKDGDFQFLIIMVIEGVIVNALAGRRRWKDSRLLQGVDDVTVSGKGGRIRDRPIVLAR